jgi:hypothetical protein
MRLVGTKGRFASCDSRQPAQWLHEKQHSSSVATSQVCADLRGRLADQSIARHEPLPRPQGHAAVESFFSTLKIQR